MARILVIATGGVRAPSAFEIVERFTSDGHEVRLLATGNALRFMLVPVLSSFGHLRLFLRHFRPQLRETLAYFTYKWTGVPHVEEGKWCDLALVVPASSNSIGKLVAGLADNYPLLVARGIPRGKPVIVIPSMNPEMWLDPFLQRNIDALNATRKYRVLCPSAGQMASGDFGIGAQVPTQTILDESYRALGLIDPLARTAPAPGTEAPDDPSPPTIVVAEEDQALREMLLAELESAIRPANLVGLGDLSAAKAWFRDNRAQLLLAGLEFSDGGSGTDLVDLAQPVDGKGPCQVILMSHRSRADAGAEAIALRDVHFLPKPINVPYAVGMAAGLIRVRTAARQGTEISLAPGDILFHAGQMGNEIYRLLSGRMLVTLARADGLPKDHEIEAGEIIGELAFITGEPRSATVTALTDCRVLRIETSDFTDYLSRQPVWLGRILNTLIERVRRADRQ